MDGRWVGGWKVNGWMEGWRMAGRWVYGLLEGKCMDRMDVWMKDVWIVGWMEELSR